MNVCFQNWCGNWSFHALGKLVLFKPQNDKKIKLFESIFFYIFLCCRECMLWSQKTSTHSDDVYVTSTTQGLQVDFQ